MGLVPSQGTNIRLWLLLFSFFLQLSEAKHKKERKKTNSTALFGFYSNGCLQWLINLSHLCHPSEQQAAIQKLGREGRIKQWLPGILRAPARQPDLCPRLAIWRWTSEFCNPSCLIPSLPLSLQWPSLNENASHRVISLQPSAQRFAFYRSVCHTTRSEGSWGLSVRVLLLSSTLAQCVALGALCECMELSASGSHCSCGCRWGVEGRAWFLVHSRCSRQ